MLASGVVENSFDDRLSNCSETTSNIPLLRGRVVKLGSEWRTIRWAKYFKLNFGFYHLINRIVVVFLDSGPFHHNVGPNDWNMEEIA